MYAKETNWDWGKSKIQIKPFIILAVLRRSVQRVGGAHLRVIAPTGNTAPFEEMSQR